MTKEELDKRQADLDQLVMDHANASMLLIVLKTRGKDD